MKNVVVGASGYIGGLLYSVLKDNYNTIGTSTVGSNDLVRLRFESLEDFDFSVFKDHDVIFIAAAISSPDVCSHRYDYAWAVNVTGTSLFIAKAISIGMRVIFFSSDVVYGQSKHDVDETAPINPVGAYAVMKNEVERRFLGNPSFKTIRVSYVFSKEDRFTKYLCKCVDMGVDAEIFHPFYRAFVHRDDVVQGAIALAHRWIEFPQSIINIGGPEVISRIEFAQIIKDNVLPSLRFRQSEPGKNYFDNRPQVIKMKSPYFESLLGRAARSVRNAIHLEYK